MANAMTSTWTKQEVEAYDRHKMTFYLRRDTPYRSIDDFFHALLAWHGAPPFYPEQRHVYDSNVVSGRLEFLKWRERVAITLNETLHCSIDPSFVMREYFAWLRQHW